MHLYANQADDFLTSGASSSQQRQYDELMEKMKLLADQASSKSLEMAQKAQAQKIRAQELNKFQTIVKDLYTSNMV